MRGAVALQIHIHKSGPIGHVCNWDNLATLEGSQGYMMPVRTGNPPTVVVCIWNFGRLHSLRSTTTRVPYVSLLELSESCQPQYLERIEPRLSTLQRCTIVHGFHRETLFQ